jgi:hypothetical protein
MVWKKIALSLGLGAAAANSAADGDVRLKEIEYRGGLVRFTIPENWREEYEGDGGGMFYEDRKDSGTLRINVITAGSPKPLGNDEPIEMLKGTRGVSQTTIVRLPNGNGFATSQSHAVEQETQITLFWWYVTNLVRPDHVRIATFSYTVLRSLENDPRTLAELKMLDSSIRDTKFHPGLGVTTTH